MELTKIKELAGQPRFVDEEDVLVEPISALEELYAAAIYSASEPRDWPVNATEANPAAGIIPDGARNTTLTKWGGYARRKGAEYLEIRDFLLAINQNRCLTPLTEDEVEKIAHSVCRYQPEDPVLVSVTTAAPGDGVVAAKKLKFFTGREIYEQTPEEPDWVCRPYVARGAITELDGKPKAAGKTTFLTHAVRRVLDGEEFLGERTKKTGVVYLTEQSKDTFREVLDRADLLGRDDFAMLPWGDAVGISWEEVVAQAVEEATKRGAGLLVVDTLPQFAGLKGDSENNAGAALAAIQPLQEAAAVHNLAVVLVRHERKSGGEVGDSGRGSSAFAGAVDVVMSLRRTEGNGNRNTRVIKALSRYDETPDTLIVELTPGGFEVKGQDTPLAGTLAREAILDVAPCTEETAMTSEGFLAETEGFGRTLIKRVLNEMTGDEILVRFGKGKKGDPYRYWRPSEEDDLRDDNPDGDDEMHSAATPSPGAKQRAEKRNVYEHLAPEEGVEEEEDDRDSPASEAAEPVLETEAKEDNRDDEMTDTERVQISEIERFLRQKAVKRPEFLTGMAGGLIFLGTFDSLDFEPTDGQVEEAQLKILEEIRQQRLRNL